MKKVDKFYAQRGYEEISTGGGCTAYCKNFDELGLYVLITGDEPDGDGSLAPRSVDSPATAGLYSRNDAQARGYISAPSAHQLFCRIAEGVWKEQL